jgi:uncharacterized protein (TIGR01732 family)
MIRVLRASVGAVFLVSLTVPQSALAGQPLDWWWQHRAAKACLGEPDCLPCAGRALVIEEADPETGAPIRVRLGEFSAERDELTIIVRHGSEVILSVYLDDDVLETGEFSELVEALKVLTDICALDPKSLERFDSFVRAVVIPKLVALGLPSDALASTDDEGSAFILIVVLFILLVIVGAGFGG